jgi:hypothetical protein
MYDKADSRDQGDEFVSVQVLLVGLVWWTVFFSRSAAAMVNERTNE